MSATGNLFVVVAPSGAGKTSLVNRLLHDDPNIRLSVSYTTRAPREGEVNGRDYHFVDRATFETMIAAGDFFEHANVYGNYYGTSKRWIETELAGDHDVLLEIDWQGAAQVRKLIPDAIHIFILPPTLESLNERLEKRGQDPSDVIARRVEAAHEEMRHWADFDYVIMNQDFARAADDLSAIVRAARLTTPRQGVRHAALIAQLLHI
jgi:guanylate kinase